MFCSQCGTKNNDDAKFCSSCGTAIAGLNETKREPRVTASPSALGNSTESDSPSSEIIAPKGSIGDKIFQGFKWTVYSIFGLGIALVLAMLGYMFLTKGSSKEAPPTSPSAVAPVKNPSPEEMAEKARRSACDWDIAKDLTNFASNRGRLDPPLARQIGHDIAWEKGQNGFDLDGSSGKIVDTGTYKFNDKALPVCVVEIALSYVNRSEGKRKVSCYVVGYANDREFNIYRAILTSECAEAPQRIAKWRNENRIDDLRSPVAPSAAPAQSAAAPAGAIPVAAQIEKQKKLFIARACPPEEKAESEERTTQHGDVAANSGEKYVFVHILCGRSSHALAMIYNGKTVARGREFLNVLGGEGKYTAETGKLTYSAQFAADGDAQCCPSGVGEVVLDAAKLEMVFRKIKPQGEDKRVPSRDVTLP